MLSPRAGTGAGRPLRVRGRHEKTLLSPQIHPGVFSALLDKKLRGELASGAKRTHCFQIAQEAVQLSFSW
jgi:hypothetical protein